MPGYYFEFANLITQLFSLVFYFISVSVQLVLYTECRYGIAQTRARAHTNAQRAESSNNIND